MGNKSLWQKRLTQLSTGSPLKARFLLHKTAYRLKITTCLISPNLINNLESSSPSHQVLQSVICRWLGIDSINEKQREGQCLLISLNVLRWIFTPGFDRKCNKGGRENAYICIQIADITSVQSVASDIL